jgi:hypothetical protein
MAFEHCQHSVLKRVAVIAGGASKQEDLRFRIASNGLLQPSANLYGRVLVSGRVVSSSSAAAQVGMFPCVFFSFRSTWTFLILILVTGSPCMCTVLPRMEVPGVSTTKRAECWCGGRASSRQRGSKSSISCPRRRALASPFLCVDAKTCGSPRCMSLRSSTERSTKWSKSRPPRLATTAPVCEYAYVYHMRACI